DWLNGPPHRPFDPGRWATDDQIRSPIMPTRLLAIGCIAAFLLGCDFDRTVISSHDASVSAKSMMHSDDRGIDLSKSDEIEGLAEFWNKTWTIQGTVVDPDGKPIDKYDAASIWSSNGVYWNADGDVPMEEIASIWKNEGVLANRPQNTAEKTTDGMFRLQ